MICPRLRLNRPPMPTSHDDRSRPNIAAPVVVWSVIQLIPLWLLAAHVRLWARADAQVIEESSLTFMLAVQFGVSALLFPWLMQDLRSSMFVTICSGLFIELAG